jgi:hypothetical protein
MMKSNDYLTSRAILQPLAQETAKLKVLEPKVTAAKVLGDGNRRALGDIHSNNIRHGIISDSTKIG